MRIEKSPSAVFTPLPDGTGVLLNVETLVYYKLNRSAVTLWQRLEEESVTVEALVIRTCERFDVDQPTAQRAIADFIENLRETSLIRVL